MPIDYYKIGLRDKMKKLFVLAWFCGTVFLAGSILLAKPFPLFQCALIDKSGVVSFLHSVEGKMVEQEAQEEDPWVPGETLIVKEGKSCSAKIAVSDLALVSFNGGSRAKLIGSDDNRGTTPSRIVLEQGSLFYKVKKNSSHNLLIEAGDLNVKTSSGAGYMKYSSGKLQAICGGGSLLINEGGRQVRVGSGRGYRYSKSRGRGSTKKLSRKFLKKLAKAFHIKLPEKQVPVLPDKIPPHVTIITPKDGQVIKSGSVEVAGAVHDPSVNKVEVIIQNASRGLRDVQAGQFRFRAKLYAKRNTIIIRAEDNNLTGAATVVVECKKPMDKPEGLKEDEPEGALQSALKKVTKLIKNPSNPMFFVVFILVGGLLLFSGYLIIRRIYATSKKSLKKASELATGIVFQRCEKCSNREYHYHLFYTTESVNSPFLRNLINNVNPMATNMMNESLESLLSTGLKWSQKAKQAENKIRVICSWCDFCKTGTLSLEHMQGEAVTKVDDYQIIHPIFIEWVRKVYD